MRRVLLLAILAASAFALAGSLQAQSPFLRDDIDDPEYSDAYRQRLRALRERVAEERRERQERIERESRGHHRAKDFL